VLMVVVGGASCLPWSSGVGLTAGLPFLLAVWHQLDSACAMLPVCLCPYAREKGDLHIPCLP